MDISRSIGANGSTGHFCLAILVAWYRHDVHMHVITSFKYMVIDQMKKKMFSGHSICPLDPMDKQNSNRHFHLHSIQWIHWTLSFGYLSGLVSTRRPYACHYVIQRDVNWPTEKAMVHWTFHSSIGSNGHAKVQRTVRDPFDKWNVQ